ncbi:pre-mRNA-splicing factor CWC25-like isoform X1 [Cucurbita moschata]|uniref:Pre-mRNA-splicing factor CWC25-like isoform X1 n=1 Tax=Cucurbita moschata TaxID=3662 RepID=A0A6J1FPJ0_CUCMO|nr:pre-mRNA-splicing factor CWC25-like isoform X1 [Cucurbita moschata]XP_022942671.1 pre-mRNA-splicing factor CWC25-like isoform X1 [Cucurbita moschata]
MSRREARESDSKRYRSRFDKEPSPKRSRRDRKPLEEKLSRNSSSHVEDNKDRDQKHELRHEGQDATPHESSLALDSHPEGGVSKGANRNSDEREGGTKRSLNPTEVPRSRSYFQHDKRGSAGQVGRSFGRSSSSGRGWWKDSKEQDKNSDRASGKTATYNSQRRDEIPQTVKEDNHTRTRDGSSKLEVDSSAPARKRPAFREKKITPDNENFEKAGMASESKKPSDPHQPQDGRERREERGRDTRYSDKLSKHVTGDMASKRDEMKRGGYSVRERYGNGGGGGNYRGRDRFGGRQGYPASGGTRVEKWKHDLFHEANRSPTPKNEEDQIAKVEALLAS